MSRKKLLLAEDEGYAASRALDILSGFPQFEAVLAGGGEEARKLLAGGAFDAVVAGIYLKGVSGLELLHLARLKNPEVCFIILAGEGCSELTDRALKEGAFDVIIKPGELDRLAVSLRLFAMVKA